MIYKNHIPRNLDTRSNVDSPVPNATLESCFEWLSPVTKMQKRWSLLVYIYIYIYKRFEDWIVVGPIFEGEGGE